MPSLTTFSDAPLSSVTQNNGLRSVTIPHLNPGSSYQFKVLALNMYGAGPASTPSGQLNNNQQRTSYDKGCIVTDTNAFDQKLSVFCARITMQLSCFDLTMQQ